MKAFFDAALSLFVLALLCFGSGCATLAAGPRLQSRVVIGFAEVIDQSTSCVLGITELTHGKYIRGNSCHK